MIPWTNESVWLDAAPENKSGSLWFIFHGSVILSYILKAIWRINMITWAYESVWFDAWPQNKNGSLWPIFHGSMILHYIFKTYWCINMMPWNNESVWPDALPQNKTVSLWPVFHGSVILPYILKAIWCIYMILWANKSVWLDAWPQNKSLSLWPIFHGSVAYILKTILCIRRWHWPGVYVSPCSLALVRFMMIMQIWTAISPQKKIFNQFFARVLRLQEQHWKRGSPPELIIYQQNLFKLAGYHHWCLTEIYNNIWRTGKQPASWTQSLIVTLPKKAT